MGSIYEDIMKECPTNYVGHYESDLFLLKNDETTGIITRHKDIPCYSVSEFNHQVSKDRCYKIAFGYKPFWDKINDK